MGEQEQEEEKKEQKQKKVGDRDPLAPDEDRGDPTAIFEQIEQNYQPDPDEQGTPESEARPENREAAETDTGLSQDEQTQILQKLHQKWQDAEKKLKQAQAQEQPRDDRGRFTKQDYDVEAEAIGKFLKSNPQALQQMVGQQSQQSDEVQLDPDDVDPFRFFEDGSKENQWLQQQIDQRAEDKTSQRVNQALQPLMDKLTLQEMRTRATQEFDIPEDRVDDFLEFLQQPKDQILGNPQTIAKLYKLQSGVSESTANNNQSDESTDVSFDIDELRKMIDTEQQQTSPAGSEQNAGSEYADPRDEFMDQIIKAANQGYVP